MVQIRLTLPFEIMFFLNYSPLISCNYCPLITNDISINYHYSFSHYKTRLLCFSPSVIVSSDVIFLCFDVIHQYPTTTTYNRLYQSSFYAHQLKTLLMGMKDITKRFYEVLLFILINYSKQSLTL